MTTYGAYEVDAGGFRLVDRDLVEPVAGHVRIKVEACGVCHSDVAAVDQLFGQTGPVVPGHEIVGVIDAVGEGVHKWHAGERVGVGFLGGQCGECDFCRRGDFVNCTDQPYTGTVVDGGYAEYAYARASGLARIPDGLTSLDAAPLLCAGLTTFTALRQVHARPGELVAVQGIGGLGHLAVQQAKKLGFRVAAIARGTGKAALAEQLGADVYLDATAEDPGAALQKLGGAAAILATASSGASMSPLLGGLRPRGQMMVLGLPLDPVQVDALPLIFGTRSIAGSLTGSSIENEDNLAFSVANGVLPMNEVRPWTDAPAAYEHMMSGKARFRVVLSM
ncbi:alcohol dehydrogenase catalytic domain-containing protein [Kibdelosporangium aridum]|uniref:Alcohol dehydrogenase n=1 Tax=Kibdelosporangium aridum TaxID=2030 RepID=A0A1Y5XYY5_KIBAR|nr:alcohol dehydrogenase catalytic domain-containing protein [Kibdelosporangium aridum]SMD22052.1 alcohol dehydrogenase, propanol-preferring [Kibdelosporangium aridum]